MKSKQQWISHATDALSVDPELKLDVSRELETHLEDSMAELQAGGMDPQAAEDQAIKSLGDPQGLSDQLWQANRRRVRLRGWIRWAARIALIPGAIMVLFWLVTAWHDPTASWGYLNPPVNEEARFILNGHPQATTPLERSKSIADRWPENPLYAGNYASHCIPEGETQDDTDQRQVALDALERAETMNPDNAFYPLMRASLILNASAEYLDEDDCECDEEEEEEEEEEFSDNPVTTITDPEQFAHGLALFQQALAKPSYAFPGDQMFALRRRLLPPRDGYLDLLRLAGMAAAQDYRTGGYYRQTCRLILGYALAQAQAGNQTQARFWLGQVDRYASMVGAHSESVIDLLVAMAMRSLTLQYGVQIEELVGDETRTEEYRLRYRKAKSEFKALMDREGNDFSDSKHWGLQWAMLQSGLPGFRAEYEPIRSLEVWVFNGVSMLILLFCITGLALLLGGMTLLGFFRRKGRPVLLFVGWENLGRICLWSIVVPLGIYSLYVLVTTQSESAFGLNYSLPRVMLEIVLVAGIVAISLLTRSGAAIRRRADELGITVPPKLTYRRRVITWSHAALVVTLGLVSIVYWWIAPPPISSTVWMEGFIGQIGIPQAAQEVQRGRSLTILQLVLTADIVLATLLWTLREYLALLRKPYAIFRRSLVRSMVPILASAVILIGLLCGTVLRRAEIAASRRATGDAEIGFLNEVPRSNFRQFQDQFRQRLQELGSPEKHAQ